MFFPGRFLGPGRRCVEVPKILQGLHTFELLLAVLCPQWRCQDLGMSPDSARSWLTHGIFTFKVWSFNKNIRHKTTEQEKTTTKMPTLHLSFFHWPHIPWPHRELHPNVSNQRISHEGHQALHASNLCTIFFAQMFREVFGLTGGGGQQQQMFCFLFFNGERSAILTLFSTWIAIVRYASPCECASGEKTSTKNALSNNHTIFVICLLCHFYLRLSTFHPGSLKPASLEVGTWRREFIIAWKPKFLFHYSIYPSQGKFSWATSDIRTASQSKRIVD